VKPPIWPSRRTLRAGCIAAALLAAAGWLLKPPGQPAPWTAAEIELLRSLWIGSLPPLPPDPSNAVADDPAAARLGERLFFDTRLSANGEVSCATCHRPDLGFTDGLPKGRGIGEAGRHTMGIAGSAYSPWLYWDGRKDSLWAQALTPLEHPREHGGHRDDFARLIATDDYYRSAFAAIFGALPDLDDADGPTALLVRLGKAIAAYERLIQFPVTRFDRYIEAVLAADLTLQQQTFEPSEVRGLSVFIDAGQCIQCHNGPLLTNHEFHNTGVLSAPGEPPDRGRIDGWRALEADPFSCQGPYSDDETPACEELRFARSGMEVLGALRTPTLRNVAQTAPYMHGGQIATLEAVIRHYDRAPPAMIGHNEIEPLRLSARQRADLEAFLHTLTGAPPVPELGE
jgi:cytochrome c peroxidase